MRRPKYSIRVEGYEYVVNRRLDGKSLVLSLGEVATAVSGHGITHEVKLGHRLHGKARKALIEYVEGLPEHVWG